MATLTERETLAVDYPQQGETVTGTEYVIRLSAPAKAERVEVSINQEDWRPCRKAGGYWWHDWSGYDEGEHEVVARVVLEGGATITSEPHEFFVRLQG